MDKNTIKYDDEIDLTEQLNIIWRGKIKIFLITIISILICLGLNYQKPYVFSSSINIKQSNDIKFSDYEAVNFFLLGKDLHIYSVNKKNKTKDIVLDRFIDELMDHEELNFTISKKKNKENISISSSKSIQKKLTVERLKINESDDESYSYNINFTWHDNKEAIDILEQTLDLTLVNLENFIFDELENSLKIKKKITINLDQERAEFLKEQGLIAKELNLLTNQIDNKVLLQSSFDAEKSQNNTYYLRGYTAIQKEIEIINNREYSNLDNIQKEINSLKEKNIQWVSYNPLLINVKSYKTSQMNLLMFIILGLVIGIIFAFISDALKSQKFTKKETN